MRKSQIVNLGVCPHCCSGKIMVYSSQKPYRYWKCKVCGKNWKTLEVMQMPGWEDNFFDHLQIKNRPVLVNHIR